MTLNNVKKRWEEVAQSDPLWAICTDPLKKGRKWKIDDLFAAGEKEIQTVIAYINSLGLSIDKAGAALDFGCGVGRLTQSIAKHFSLCYGIDISPTMVRLANQYNKSESHCKFLMNDSEKISCFNDDFFSFIYSSITLQHIEIKWTKIYLKEFLRILKPNGILIFNMPSKDRRSMGAMERLRHKLKLRTRVKLLLRTTGLFRNITVSEQVFQMQCIPEREVIAIIENNQGKVIDVQTTNTAASDFNGELLYLKDEPRDGIIGKQYVAMKLEKFSDKR